MMMQPLIEVIASIGHSYTAKLLFIVVPCKLLYQHTNFYTLLYTTLCEE